MRKFLIFLLVLALLIPCAAAAEYDGMRILYRAWYVDGTEYTFALNTAGVPYYYVDGVLIKAAGLVFVDGFFYYVRSNGNICFDQTYWVEASAGNGYISTGQNLTFDANGRCTNPPALPTGWESEWFDSDPTLSPPTVPPTDPSEPSEDPMDPDAIPTIPPDAPISPGINYVPSILSICYKIISVPASWLFSIIYGSGMIGIFQASFLIVMVIRFLLVPVLGHSGSDASKRSRDKED